MLGLIVISPLASHAAVPSQVEECSPAAIIPIYAYPGSYFKVVPSMIGAPDSNCPSGVVGWHDGTSFTSKWVNYTNFALGGQHNPAQSFAVGINGGNATLTVIASDHIEFSEQFTGGTRHNLFFYYKIPPDSYFTAPQTVVVSSGAARTVMQYVTWHTNSSAFTSCMAPCVYLNAANSTLEIKGTGASSEVADVYYPLYSEPSSLTSMMSSKTTPSVGQQASTQTTAASSLSGARTGTTANFGIVPFLAGIFLVASAILAVGIALVRRRHRPDSSSPST